MEYVRAGKEAQQGAVELTVRCERRLQQELKKLEKNKGGRPKKTAVDDTAVSDEPATLTEMGLDRKNANRNAVLAEVTPEQFEAGAATVALARTPCQPCRRCVRDTVVPRCGSQEGGGDGL